MPFPADHLVTAFPPWQYYYGMPVKNNAMPDVVTQMYPFKHLVIGLRKKGIVPLWNPFNFCGNPLMANYQSAVFHPFNWLFFLLPEIDAWSLLILLQPLLAGLFTYLFCRQLKLSRAAALLSSIAFMFSGFMVNWMAYGTMAHALLWLPLILFGLEKSFEKMRPFSLLLISFPLAASFFSGHFQISLYVLLGSAAFLFFKLITTRKMKVFGVCLLFLFLGLLLTSLQLLPTFELYQHSVRSSYGSLPEIVPWFYSVTLLAPDFFGNPVTRNYWQGNYNEWASFVGVIPLMLAVYALLIRRKKEVAFFTSLVVLAILMSRPTPFLDLIVKLKIPVIASSAAARINGLLGFALAILAGFGFDQLKIDFSQKKFKKALFVFGLFLAVVLLVWAILFWRQPFPLDKIQIAKRNFVLPTMLVMAFGVGTIGFGFLSKLKKAKKIIIPGLLLFLSLLLSLIFFDVFRGVRKWIPFDDREHVYPQLPVLTFLTERVGPDRVFGFFGMEMMNYFQIPGFSGYDPLYSQRYGELLMTAHHGNITPPGIRGISLERRAQYTMELLNLMGGKYIFHAIDDAYHVWSFNFWDYPGQFKLIYRGDKYEIYENQGALPRAFIAYDYQVIKEPQAIVDKIYALGTKTRETLILEEKPELELEAPTEVKSKSVAIKQYLPNRIEIAFQTDKPGLLFLSDNEYPGWRALIDGQEAKIYRADYSFRAVPVPQGEHELVFLYEPVSFKWGLILSSLGFIILSMATLIIWRFKK
ncbi:MAG: YfhO family protein [Candidatus Marinimicrobia bacterium]|nr:YfhO family protein [Candidatus Neomarinimicrobiota bacterium]